MMIAKMRNEKKEIGMEKYKNKREINKPEKQNKH